MYYIIFFILACCSFLLERKPNKIVLGLIVIFFIFFVGLRGEYVDQDYQNYLYAIAKGWGIAEYSFNLISEFCLSCFDSTLMVFVIYAILGVSLKIYALYKYTDYFYISLLLYFSTYLILQEMNAMRAGVAAGFMLLSIEPWANKKYLLALVFLSLATFFHYSFAILFFVFFFVKNNERFIHYFIALIPLAYICYFSIDLSAIFPLLNIAFVDAKFGSYEKEETEVLDVFSMVFLVKIAIAFFFYFYRRFFEEKSDYFYLLLKLYIIGVFIVIAFASLPIISMRLMDVFICTELLLIPLFCDLIKPKIVMVGITIMYSAFYFYLYIIVGKYLLPYSLNI